MRSALPTPEYEPSTFQVHVDLARVKHAFGSSILSAIVHSGVIVGAVVTTLHAGESLRTPAVRRDTMMVFVTPPEQPPPPLPEDPVVHALRQIEPPPQGFQTVVPLLEIPSEIPEIDLTQYFDPRDFSGKGVEGGVSWGTPRPEPEPPPTDFAMTFTSSGVEVAPQRISCPAAKFPRLLQRSGIQGVVILQFVVGRDGHVEEETIDVIKTAHGSFRKAATDVAKGCEFEPGLIQGQAVRVMVEMPVGFYLDG